MNMRSHLLLKIAVGFITAGSTVLAGDGPAPPDSATLWRDYVESPNRHSHLPNFSYAGYGYGERPLPDPDVTLSVTDHGATADDQTDDTKAFHNAIAEVEAAGGGVVFVPPGRYIVSDILRIDRSNVVLRGAGSDRTTIHFTRPLLEVGGEIGRYPDSDKTRWSWTGGLIWIGSPEILSTPETSGNAIALRAPAERGSFTASIAHDDLERAKRLVGKPVAMHWTGDESLYVHIGGHPKFENYGWRAFAYNKAGVMTWKWMNEIVAVQGDTVTFRKPLRHEIRPGWRVTIQAFEHYVREVGVEGLTLDMPPHAAHHHKEPGYSGVFLNHAAHCWVRDLRLLRVDNGITVQFSSNNTIANFVAAEGANHHVTVTRAMSHDNLFTDFRIESQPRHGINTEGISSGNVWRNGVMMHGTFDSHRMISFDLLRSCITVHSDGGPGGNHRHGALLGRRVVHWNLEVSGPKLEWVYSPDYISMGVLAGIRGAEPVRTDKPWAMPRGDKGCILVDHGEVPTPADLYAAQLRLRLKDDALVERVFASHALPGPMESEASAGRN